MGGRRKKKKRGLGRKREGGDNWGRGRREEGWRLEKYACPCQVYPLDKPLDSLFESLFPSGKSPLLLTPLSLDHFWSLAQSMPPRGGGVWGGD